MESLLPRVLWSLLPDEWLINTGTLHQSWLLHSFSKTVRQGMIPMKIKHKLVKSLDDFAKWVKEKQFWSGLVDNHLSR